MTSPDGQLDDVKQSTLPRAPTLNLPKDLSGCSSDIYASARSSSASLVEPQRMRLSAEVPRGEDPYDGLNRSPILSPTMESGLRRIRQAPVPPASRKSSMASARGHSPDASHPPSRNPSFPQLSGPTSPLFPFGEDLTRFPSESLHSFSFAHRSSDSLYNRQNVLKRSIEFMREKLGWAASSPRIASAQARLAGDEELASMIELLQKSSVINADGLSVSTSGLGIDRGPLTGPAHMSNENIFEKSFTPAGDWHTHGGATITSPTTITEEPEESEGVHMSMRSPSQKDAVIASLQASDEAQALDLATGTANEDQIGVLPPQRPHRAALKRTYTDIAGLSLQHKLNEAISQPYHVGQGASIPETSAASFQPPPQPSRAGTMISGTERAPHGHRNNQAQAIFMTEAQPPWTITSANDLACLVFGVTRAEVRKLGIMEVIKQERRQWLEERLIYPEKGSTARQPPPSTEATSPPGKPSGSSVIAAMGNGITAKLLSKPPSRYSYAARRSKTEGGADSKLSASPAPNHNANKSRGVLLCGDVVPIQKMNGSTGSASLWVKDKGGGLIWVLEEIAEDVAYMTVDEIGSIVRGSGSVQAIWGLERLRSGMDVQRLIPALPKLKGTNTGALDYDAIAELQRFTARTSNSISIPITVEQVVGESTFRVSSFPHIAGIIVLDPASMRISSSNSVFSSALFGYKNPNGMPVTDLIPGFDDILRVMTNEDEIALVDGIVIPEHSFRRARALLALREGSGEAAAVFLRPSGLPAKHRDGAEIMIDLQMRVVKSERDPIHHGAVIEESDSALDSRTAPSECVYALWITYSRQLHAANHGIGPVTPMVSRPATPPEQPHPGTGPDHHIDSAVPSPPPSRSSGVDGDAVNEKLLESRLDGAQDADGESNTSDVEPYEHPSPELLAAGVKVVTKKSIADFNILEEMGQGAYGQVKLARYNKASAKKMVIKYVTKRRILVDTWHRDRRLGTVPLEIHVLDYLRRDGLQHPNIVEMADFFEDDLNYYIEMVPHGLPGMDLFDYIELRVTMEEAECRKIFRQVADALQHLHIKAKVVHRDIKDENVILDGEGRVKLVDFGSAAYIKSGPFDVFVGTIDYAAPEVLRGAPYRGKEQDVWALGILLYTIVYKENPFYSIDEIMDHDLRVPYVMSEDCIDLIRKMLDRDVERRIGIQAVLEHPWCCQEAEGEDYIS